MANANQEETFAVEEGTVAKKDSNHLIIGGWFSVFKIDGESVVDSDNEEVDMESYTDVYIDFAKNYRAANFDHGDIVKGALIDNILIDSPEMAKMLVHEITGLPVDEIPVLKLGHFGSFQLTSQEDYDEACANKCMFSIEGTCKRVEV